MPNNSPLFQGHHGIEQQTLGHSRLLKALADAGRFEMDSGSNLINMPNDKVLAHALGVSPTAAALSVTTARAWRTASPGWNDRRMDVLRWPAIPKPWIG